MMGAGERGSSPYQVVQLLEELFSRNNGIHDISVMDHGKTYIYMLKKDVCISVTILEKISVHVKYVK